MENATEKKSRHAPASYPAASLSLCLKKSALALDALPQLKEKAWVSQEEFARACGYKGFDGNSAPKGLIAALSHFGLIDRDAQKRIRFGAELSQALGEDSARSELIVKAVRRPKIHQALFGAFGAQAAPSRQEVGEHLIEKCGFAGRPAQIMASNFLEDLALSRSVEPAAAPALAGEFVERIMTPSGAQLSLVADKELSTEDWAYVERFIQLKSGGAR